MRDGVKFRLSIKMQIYQRVWRRFKEDIAVVTIIVSNLYDNESVTLAKHRPKQAPMTCQITASCRRRHLTDL